MNKFAKIMCYIGGANLDILEKCPTERNGFIATGIGIIITVTLSFVTMLLTGLNFFRLSILVSVIISLFYCFIIFIGYWGVLSIYRKSSNYGNGIRAFSIIATLLISFVSANAILRSITRINFDFRNIFRNNPETILLFLFILVFLIIVYLIPIILKSLINFSTYEEEKQRVEQNFISQKEADILAYQEKYQSYASTFNDANIKMESIKHLGDLSKEYHSFIEKTQRETFDYINKIEKSNPNDNPLLNDCKNKVEEQFKITLSKMGEIFSSIYKK
jgi:hypothetical protein